MPHDPTLDDEDDALDYELEPVDAHVLEQESLRAQDTIKKAQQAVDINEVYNQIDRAKDLDFDWEKIRPRFNIKSLLIVTAVMAVVLAAWRLGLFDGAAFAGLISLVLLSLATLHAWTDLRERRRQERLRERHARALARARGDDVPDEDEEEERSFGDEFFELASTVPRYGLRDLMIATAVVALVLWILLRIGLTESALLMGAFALAGVIAEAMGADPPPAFRLAWLVSVVGYCLITIGRALVA